jgi:hypothetical protein
MPHLYINSFGNPWRKHSYSAGTLFDRCPKAYFLQKVEGWRVRDNLARFEFGKALENAIQWHHDHNGEGAVEKFTQEWSVHKDNKDLQYTRVEKDWSTLLRTGTEMIRLYIIRQPSLPIPLGGATVFQREYSKEMFVNDPNYGGIEFAGRLDIIAYVDPTHPLLPRLDWKPEYGAFRPLIVDIKTSAVDFPEAYGMAAFDLQLRAYSFLTGIRDAGLLWFVKKGHSLQKGSSVTLLEDAGLFKAGQEAVIAQMDGDDCLLVANDFMIEEMEKAQGKKPDGKTDQTKAAKERRDKWLTQFGVRVKSESITKQRLQFNCGFISIESAQDAGAIAGRQVVSIVNEWHKKAKGDPNAYPNTFGVRYPHDDRQDPYFRAFILGDTAFRDANFTKSDDTEFDDLFAEEAEQEP